MRARVFPAILAALAGSEMRTELPPVRTRPVSPRDWAAKLDEAETVTLAVPGGVATFEVVSADEGRLVLGGKFLGKFGPGDEVSFYHGGEAFTFEVHRVSAGRLTLWPR